MILYLLGLAIVLLAVLIVLTLRKSKPQVDHELMGRLSILTEQQSSGQLKLAEHMQTQERALFKLIDEKLADVSKRVGDSLEQTTTKTNTSLTELKERLAVVDAAQKNITELSGHVIQLQDVLANRFARGVFGEVQLYDMIKLTLAPNMYEFQATLRGNVRVDCLLKLPNPPGSLAVDAKFPLDSYRDLIEANTEDEKKQAMRRFRDAVSKHISDIANKYILPGETADMALIFIPSEAVYAEINANLPQVVDTAFEKRVYIVSPTTLMATLNTVRGIMRDVKMREQANLIQREIHLMMADLKRLDVRVDKLGKHLQQAQTDVMEITTSKDKIISRGENIMRLESPQDDLAVENDAAEKPNKLSAV